ncbi:MAG: Protein involved in biosynthesis of mitomycin antibiotics/polyketide fumonisin [Ilumatobacteraceae bacterium]|nr:Protein involved in biosynthesis of mitomycin antibiotics/polyketide fumonisin [Ilumatobacteraceae bacterium]
MRAPGELGFLEADACDIDRPILRDPALQAEFEETGYVVLPLLDAEQVATLVDGYDRLAAALDGSSAPEDYNDTYAEFSIIHSRPEFRRRAYDLITSVLEPVAERHLVDMRPLIANFVNKLPGTGVVPTHQNFSVVDEAEHRSVSVWVALVDCVLENGAMSLLKGSHQTLRSRRGMWAYQAFSQIDQGQLDPKLTRVEVHAGDAVILDDALVHYSPPNQTGERRLAIQFVMIPQEARPLWFQQVGATDDGLDIEVWEIDERYFFEFWHGDGDERYGTHADRIVLPKVDLDLAMLEQLLAPAPAEPAAADPAPAEPVLSEPEPVAWEPVASEPAAPQRGLRALISRLSR